MARVIPTDALRAITRDSYEHSVCHVASQVRACPSADFFGEDTNFSVIGTWPDRVCLLAESGACVTVPFVRADGGTLRFGKPEAVALPVFESESERQASAVHDVVRAMLEGKKIPPAQVRALME